MKNEKHDWILTYYDTQNFATGDQEIMKNRTPEEMEKAILARPDCETYQLEVAVAENPQYPVYWWDGNGFQEV